MNATDPTGLRPLTDDDLQSYDQSSGGAIAAVGNRVAETVTRGLEVVGNVWEATKSVASGVGEWLGDNWEYIAAGAAVVGGIALLCTGVGGPAGLALMAGAGGLISGGVSAGAQKYFDGAVDWGRVAVEAGSGRPQVLLEVLSLAVWRRLHRMSYGGVKAGSGARGVVVPCWDARSRRGSALRGDRQFLVVPLVRRVIR